MKNRSFPTIIAVMLLLIISPLFADETALTNEGVETPKGEEATAPSPRTSDERTHHDASDAPRIAFIGFTAKDLPASGVDILSELVRTEFTVSPAYRLVDRRKMDAIMREQELALMGVADAKALEVGKLLGADKIVFGTIGELGSLYIINLTLIDVETGEVEHAVTEEFVGELEDLRKPVRIAAQKLMNIKGIEVDRGNFINVTSSPPGVNVYIDGLFEGSTPVKINVLKPGEHTVKLYADGYETWYQKVVVERNSTYFVNATLLKKEREDEVDEHIRALQDGRVPFIVGATIFSMYAVDGLLFTFNNENIRLYVGAPLLAGPLVFFGTLRMTEQWIMNGGRTTMILSSAAWGIAWGLTSAIVTSSDREPMYDDDGEDTNAFRWQPHIGLSVAGGAFYGIGATILTRNYAMSPQRAGLINLGSFMGSLVGIGIPFVFNVENTAVLYGSLVGGSIAGTALAIFLTRRFDQVGANVENLSFDSVIRVNDGRVAFGLPLADIAAFPSAFADGRHVEDAPARLTLLRVVY